MLIIDNERKQTDSSNKNNEGISMYKLITGTAALLFILLAVPAILAGITIVLSAQGVLPALGY